jgi:hypothetical protein
MATTEGRYIYVAVDDEIIECLMTSTMNITAAKVVESTQCGGGFEESSAGTIEWNVQVEGKLDPSKTYTGEDIMTQILAGGTFVVYWGGNLIGDVFYTGTGWFSNVSYSTNHAEQSKVTFSATIQGTGTLAASTVTASTLV